MMRERREIEKGRKEIYKIKKEGEPVGEKGEKERHTDRYEG